MNMFIFSFILDYEYKSIYCLIKICMMKVLNKYFFLCILDDIFCKYI